MKIFNGILVCIGILVLIASAFSSDSLEGTASQSGLINTQNVFIHSSASIVNTLIIETGGSLTNTVVRALDSLGVAYDFMHTEDFAGLDFSPYSTIILGMDGGLVDSTSVEAVATAASTGKKLIILGGTAYHPYYVGIQNYLLQHNGVEDWVQSATPHLTVTAPGHPLTLDLPSPYNYMNSGAAQYMLRITDPTATVVAMNGDGFPALVSKPVGNGILIYSITTPWDVHYINEPDYLVLYTIVRNALDLEIPRPPGNLIAFSGDGYVNLWWQAPPISQTISELAYDDGGDEGNLSIGSTAEGDLAVRFTPNVYPSTIMAIKVHFATAASGMSSIDWTIWDGTSAGPGTSLATGNHPITRGVFDSVDVASAALQINSGDFFISYFEPNGQTMNLSWDTTQPSANRSWVNAPGIGFPWQTLAQTGISGFDNNLMIRAIVMEGSGPNATLVELSPANKSLSTQVNIKGRSLPVAEELQADALFQNYYLDGTPPSRTIAYGSVNLSSSENRIKIDGSSGLANAIPAVPEYGIGGLDSYNIYRSTDGISFSRIDSVNALNYTDNNVVNGNVYWYYVTAVYTEGESSPSDTVRAAPNVLPSEGTLFASTGNAGGALITIDPATGQGTSIAPLGAFGPVTEIEFRGDGVLFGATGQGSSHIIIIDPLSGIEDTLGTHPFGATNGLEFDDSGNLLGTFYDPPDTSWLVEIDQSTGQFISIAGPTGVTTITGLAFHPNGTLYGIGNFATGAGSPSSLYTINPVTGVATLVGSVGFNNVGAMEFGPNGILYGGVGSGGGSFAGHLITIDPTTGAGTAIGPSGYPGISGLSFYPAPMVSIDDGRSGKVPQQFELYQNYPNPFNPTTIIRFQLPEPKDIRLDVFDISGKEVRTLIDGKREIGLHEVQWDGRNEAGRQVSSGIYFYRLKAGDLMETKKMMILR